MTEATTPEVKQELTAAEALDAKIVAAEERLSDLKAQRERLSYVDSLVKGVYVHAVGRAKEGAEPEKLFGKIIAVTEQEGRGTWYKLRVNEDTDQEDLISVRLGQITGIHKPQSGSPNDALFGQLDA